MYSFLEVTEKRIKRFAFGGTSDFDRHMFMTRDSKLSTSSLCTSVCNQLSNKFALHLHVYWLALSFQLKTPKHEYVKFSTQSFYVMFSAIIYV